jgi:cardiolipin synthase
MNRKNLAFVLILVGIVIFVLFKINSTPDSSAKIVSAPAGTLSLVSEPEAGIAPVLAKINGAKKSVDLVMYEFEDMQVEQALEAAKARGVLVRVLLNQGYYGKPEANNEPAYAYLQAHNVPVHWTPSYFALTHQKTLVVDGSDALIMTFNFTPQYYKSSRDFAVDDTDANDVSAIEKIFDADWQGNTLSVSAGDDLVWSPGSRNAMLSLIENATSSIEIYNEEMADPTITTALEDVASRGVNVEVCMTYSSSWKNSFEDLANAGVHVRTFAASASLYIHAKVILVDSREAFVGSENFSPTSLDSNRELGLVVSDSNIINSLGKIFQNDWQNATITQF